MDWDRNEEITELVYKFNDLLQEQDEYIKYLESNQQKEGAVLFDEGIHTLKEKIPVTVDVYNRVLESYNMWLTLDKKKKKTFGYWCDEMVIRHNIKAGQARDIAKQKYDKRRYV